MPPTPITRYASIADLQGVGINEGALRGLGPDDKNAALDKASRLMDSFFRARWTLPLTQVGADVSMKCAFIAAYLLLVGRGFNPDKGGDNIVVKNYDDAMRWLGQVRDMDLTPDVTDSSSAPVEGKPTERARMMSAASRGWSTRTTHHSDRGNFRGD